MRSQNIISLCLKVKPCAFRSEEQIKAIARLVIDGKYQDSLQNNTYAMQRLFSEPEDVHEQEVIIFCSKDGGLWPDIECTPGFYESLYAEGYKPFRAPHPSLLINTFAKLRNERSNIRFPKTSSLILVSDIDSRIPSGDFKKFFAIGKTGPHPDLCLIKSGGYGKKVTLLLQKK